MIKISLDKLNTLGFCDATVLQKKTFKTVRFSQLMSNLNLIQSSLIFCSTCNGASSLYVHTTISKEFICTIAVKIDRESKCKQSKCGVMVGLSHRSDQKWSHNLLSSMTSQLVSETNVITITKLMLICDTFLKVPWIAVFIFSKLYNFRIRFCLYFSFWHLLRRILSWPLTLNLSINQFFKKWSFSADSKHDFMFCLVIKSSFKCKFDRGFEILFAKVPKLFHGSVRKYIEI